MTIIKTKQACCHYFVIILYLSYVQLSIPGFREPIENNQLEIYFISLRSEESVLLGNYIGKNVI